MAIRGIKRDNKGVISININMRPLCKCGYRPAAINYIKNERTYYRKLCETCLKNGLYHGIPRWFRSGYTIKNQCDKCGYKSQYTEIFAVFHVDGNLNNCRPSNLKTVCSNCQRILHLEGIYWKQGDLHPDL
jgi:hypothetical protein